MATYTTRNDLLKPDYTDAADIKDLNDNFDFIDGSIAPCSWNKTTAPTINDDVTYGYIIGSMWFDITNHKLYICESAIDGAAVWRQIYPAVMDLTGAVLTNGTVPLTAAWDAGSYQIRAETFQSDVATGTAPFTVASTTRVSNLNAATCGDADTLDTLQSTAFAILAGQSGGQTLYGGTATAENLTLYATSKDATGAIKMPNGGLEIGTKATTATYGAINIHEGAAGAANAITFLDGDGSTARASIYKDSNDSLIFTGGTSYSAYIDGPTGKLVDNAGFTSTMSPVNDAYTNNISLTNRPTWTADSSATFYGIYDAIFPEVRTSKSQSGACLAYYTECMRNHNGASTDDDGSLTSLYAFRAVCGHYNLNTSMKGTTTNAYCFMVSPYATKGTITNIYGIYIADLATGGTATNKYPFYSAWNAQHYFGGDIYTVGNCSALSFTDRTPHYDGDARAELKKIKGKDGQIDHDTLPEFARATLEGKPVTRNKGKRINELGLEEDDIEVVSKEVEVGRDLGAMVSMLVKAVQQLDAENTEQASQIAALLKKHDDNEKRMAKLEARIAKLEKQ